MIKQYHITVAIVANGKSEKEVREYVSNELDKIYNAEDGTDKIIEDCWIDSIEEDDSQ